MVVFNVCNVRHAELTHRRGTGGCHRVSSSSWREPPHKRSAQRPRPSAGAHKCTSEAGQWWPTCSHSAGTAATPPPPSDVLERPYAAGGGGVPPPGPPSHPSPPPLFKHPNQEGNTNCCVRTKKLMAESVYGGGIQSIDTDH